MGKKHNASAKTTSGRLKNNDRLAKAKALLHENEKLKKLIDSNNEKIQDMKNDLPPLYVIKPLAPFGVYSASRTFEGAMDKLGMIEVEDLVVIEQVTPSWVNIEEYHKALLALDEKDNEDML